MSERKIPRSSFKFHDDKNTEPDHLDFLFPRKWITGSARKAGMLRSEWQ